MVQFCVDTFHDHNRVIDHNRNCKHHRGEGEEVEREADEVEHEERTNQRHRDGDGGNDGASEVLQEDEDHDEHEDECLDERLDDFMDGGEEEVVHVLCDADAQSVGHVFLAFVEQGDDVVHNLGCVGACNLHDDTRHGAVTVHASGERVGASAEFHSCHVFDADDCAVGVGADDHVLKLRGFGQTTFVAERILERLVLSFSDASRCGFDVLFSQDGGDVGRHEVVFRHFLRLEPDSHGVISTHHHRVADTFHTLHLRNDVNLGVVLNEVRSVFVSFVHDGEDDEHGALSLLCDDADLCHFGGEETLCFCHAVLDVDGSHVGVSPLLEGDADVGGTGVGGGGRHVVHVFHTVDLFFQRRDDRVQHGLCVGTGVGGADLDGGRSDVRILSNRQRDKTEHTENHDDDGNHRGEHRAVDKSI